MRWRRLASLSSHDLPCVGPAQAIQNTLRRRQTTLLLQRIRLSIEIREQFAQGEELCFYVGKIHMIGQHLNDLMGDKGTEIFDGGEMGIGIAACERNGAGEALHQLTKPLQGHCHGEGCRSHSDGRLVRQDVAMLAWRSFSIQRTRRSSDRGVCM